MKHVGQKVYFKNNKTYNRTSDVYAIYGRIIEDSFTTVKGRPVYKAVISTAKGNINVQTMTYPSKIEYNLDKNIDQMFIVDTHPKYEPQNIYMLCRPRLINELEE